MPWFWLCAVVIAVAGWPTPTSADTAAVGSLRGHDPELARRPSWTSPSRAEVRDRALTWAAAVAGEQSPEGPVTRQVADLWEDAERSGSSGPANGADLVDLCMATAAIVDPRAAAIRGAIEHPAGLNAATAWLDDASTVPFARATVRLWLGRELVRRNRFDEARPLLADLDLTETIDPAAVLFFRGCCEHWLLAPEAAAESFDRLLERESEIPVRYARLARLLRADIAALETDSLDHIARRMRDVRRRLDLGQAGPLTRGVQQGVVESLDKLIDELENQQQQGQSASSGAGRAGEGGASGTPMEDSRIAGGRGAGEVQKKELGSGAGWGNLPPHEREAALQQIGREYPPHYREAIEQYFKRLATGGEADR